MFKVEVDQDALQRIQAQINEFSPRRFRGAVATALTRTAKAVRDKLKEKAPADIDRPTPFTMRTFFFRGANANKLEARVWFGNEYGEGGEKGRFLTPIVEGAGTRRLKRFERALMNAGVMPPGTFAVPASGARLDAYGNVQRSQIAQIVSQVGTELTAGYSRTLRRRPGESNKRWGTRRKQAFGKAGGQYFAVRQRRGKLRPGIYLAKGRYFGASLGYGRSGQISLVLAFVPRVSYRKQFYFYEIAEQVSQREFGKQLEIAVEQSAARLAAKTSGSVFRTNP